MPPVRVLSVHAYDAGRMLWTFNHVIEYVADYTALGISADGVTWRPGTDFEQISGAQLAVSYDDVSGVTLWEVTARLNVLFSTGQLLAILLTGAVT